MDINNYQNWAMTFRMDTADEEYALLNLAAEVGELLSLYAKARRDGTKLDKSLVQKELGDILWQVAAVASDNYMSLSNVANENLIKLEDRRKRNAIVGSGDER